ncbi:MAG: hypothetical protein DMG09_00620 [Acidobacteria bacterium]|nr:MAG: hypothetical protein DMG09_00620 [Acidobacteriota bacterium]
MWLLDELDKAGFERLRQWRMSPRCRNFSIFPCPSCANDFRLGKEVIASRQSITSNTNCLISFSFSILGFGEGKCTCAFRVAVQIPPSPVNFPGPFF